MTDAACNLIPGHKQWLSIDLPQLLVGELGIDCHYLQGNIGAERYLLSSTVCQSSMREAIVTQFQGSNHSSSHSLIAPHVSCMTIGKAWSAYLSLGLD